MLNCLPNIKIHKEAGSTQADRLLNALKTSSIKIDERKIEDLILFTNKLSQNINYYTKSNAVLGSWNSFFQWESTSILAQISKIDIEQYLADLVLIRRQLLFVEDLNDQQDIVLPFFNTIEVVIADLYKKIKQLPNELEIKEYYESSYPAVEKILVAILLEINSSTDLIFTLQHHLFNKKNQNLFGLLTDWKKKSITSFQENLESYANHSPQYALYLSFLQLFEVAQNDLNKFTKRHLDFYYKDILRLEPEGSKPDNVHITIEPHKNSLPFLIEKDSVFLAGKNTEGQNKYYRSIADNTINQVKSDQIFGAFKKDNIYYFENLIDKNATGESFRTFTNNTISKNIGFAIASPLLYLRGGKRTIKLRFKEANSIINVNTNNYDFCLTGEKEWITISDVSKEGKTIIIVIPTEEKAIIPFDSEIHQGTVLDTDFPVLKIIAKNGALNNFYFSAIDVEVIVKDLNQFNLYSDTGIIDSTKPFQPFGAIPKKGNGFVFSCKEFFQKKGAKGQLKIITDSSTNINVQQQATPQAKSSESGKSATSGYSIHYLPTSWSILKKTRLTFLREGKWISGDNWESGNRLSNKSVIPYNFSANSPLTKEDTSGFAKIILTDNNYSEENYLEAYITAAKNLASTNLPYVPTIELITFDYSVRQTFGIRRNNEFEFIQIYPKGYKELKSNTQYILPRILNDGEIFIGLKDVKAGNAINLLFQLDEGSANPRQEPAVLNWNYLNQNSWNKITPENIVDETVGLTQSGIVQIKVPDKINLENQSILPPNIWWIRIDVPERVDAINNFVGIHPQALKAILFDFENIGVGFTENIAAKTISKLFSPKNEIKKIEQPYQSFGGKINDTDELFYQRTSERLRHKDRAITTWDYEKLILDNFSEVFRVKCLNHYRYDSAEVSNVSAGCVTIIPVAKSTTKNLPNYWKPIVDIGTMKNIKTFLNKKTSLHVRVQVKAPKLEKLELDFKVKFRETLGADSNLNKQLLEDVINAYLSPWAYDENTPISFQTSIEKSRIIQLIEKQSYVDYIAEFKVNHLILAETTDKIIKTISDVAEITPKTDFTLFIPNKHKIAPITNTCCS